MSEYRLLTQRIGLVGLVNLLSGFSGIILLPVLSKNLPLVDYGIWAQANVTISLVSLIMIAGLPESLTRFLAAAKEISEVQERFYTILAMTFTISTVVSLIMFVFSKSISTVLFDGNLSIAELLIPVIFLQSLNMILFYYFRTRQQMKRYSIMNLANIYLDLLLISLFVLTRHGLYGAVQSLLISRALLFSAMLLIIISEIGIVIPKFKDAWAYLTYGLPLIPSSLASWVMNSSNRYVITILIGTAAVGVYSPGYLLGNLVVMFVGPLAFVLPPALSKYYDQNNGDMVQITLSRSLKYYLALAIPSVFGLSVLSRPILSILSTPEIANQGYQITPFVAVSMLLFGIVSILSNILWLRKKTTISCMVWVIGGIVNLVSTVILVHSIGLIGAAIGTLLAFATILVLIAYCALNYMIFRIDWTFISKSIMASVVMSLAISFRLPSGSMELFLAVVVGVVIYFATLMLIGGLERSEVAFFKETLLRKP